MLNICLWISSGWGIWQRLEREQSFDRTTKTSYLLLNSRPHLHVLIHAFVNNMVDSGYLDWRITHCIDTEEFNFEIDTTPLIPHVESEISTY